MKTTLTQAWEARGVHGMLLRSRVRDLLVRRFYSDEKKRALAITFVGEFLAAILAGIGSYAVLSFALRVMAPALDLSRTSEFLLLLLMIAAGTVIGILALVFAVWLVRDAASIGNIDRYIFEQRDEEVEL